ncbi:MAG: TlyA family RNA methyltransferase [Clostridia bacterium]|nr:TlyA family RNA methyltransferase [Clostridia bacterium]
MTRLDLYLYQNGLAPSRQQAKNLIVSSQVFVNGTIQDKPSFPVPDGAAVSLLGEGMKYVGRGGIKLEHALDAFSVDPSGFRCADIGASTGGFTDCLLQRGASCVYAIDVGRDQLSEKLRKDDRVRSVESFNARELCRDVTEGAVDLCVCDVSFISLTYLFGPISSLLEPYNPERRSGALITLIKPQFEAGRESIGKKGIVKDPRVHRRILSDVIRSAETFGFRCLSLTSSPIAGGDGNREFLGFFGYRAPESIPASDTAGIPGI